MSALDSQLSESPRRVRPRWRLLVRMLLGCVVVIAATAATVATGTLLEVKTFTDALKQSPQLKLGTELASANAGGPLCTDAPRPPRPQRARDDDAVDSS